MVSTLHRYYHGEKSGYLRRQYESKSGKLSSACNTWFTDLAAFRMGGRGGSGDAWL
jgi:hypothetical protein